LGQAFTRHRAALRGGSVLDKQGKRDHYQESLLRRAYRCCSGEKMEMADKAKIATFAWAWHALAPA
jgi:hypothetical protein